MSDIEIATRVPKKYRFPFFTKSVYFLPRLPLLLTRLHRICWYAADRYVRDLKSKEELSSRVLEGLAALATYLVSEARSIERGTSKDAKDHVPGDRVRDPGALARELRWRVRNARGVDSDGEGGAPTQATSSTSTFGGNTAKRKRTEEPSSVVGENEAGKGTTNGNRVTPELPVKFRNFVPRPWVETRRDSAVSTCWVAPDSIQEEEASEAKLVPEESPGAAELQTRVDTIIKTRRSEGEDGKVVQERQTITRTLDIYTWDSSAVGSFGEDVKMDDEVHLSGLKGQEHIVNTSIPMSDTSMSGVDAQILKSPLRQQL